MRAFSFLILALSLAACAANTGQSKIYSYELGEMNQDGSTKCATGQQAFTNLKAECLALEDETLNHSCALEQRQSEFAKQCPGQIFKSTNLPKSASSDDAPSDTDSTAQVPQK